MALTDENGGGMVMPVSPMYGNGGGFGGFGDGGGFWILILFILLGGWGNGFGGGFGGGDMYPWLNNSNQINNGFRDQMLGAQINGIQNSITSGFGDIQTALCGGFAGVTNTLNANQMADMERSFAVQSALQNCCCENRAATADLKYTVATEACADRNAIASALRDVLTATQAQTQTILDKMCAQEIDNLKAQNIALQNQINMQALAASQTAQTAALVADNTAQTQYLVNRISPYPVPAYTVANPNTPAA